MANTNTFCQLCGFRDKQDMVIGLAFTTPFESKQFTLFRYILHVDTMVDTNKEPFALVTIAGIACFLPCKKSWPYRRLTCVKVAVSDGNSQEIGQLCSAIGRFFPEAFCIQCGWHIVNWGWNDIVKLPLGGYTKRKRAAHLTGISQRKPPPLTFANKVAQIIYRWIFSWCRPGYCITHDEFVTSYALFGDFLSSGTSFLCSGKMPVI